MSAAAVSLFDDLPTESKRGATEHRTCEECGKDFELLKSVIRSRAKVADRVRFCSTECRYANGRQPKCSKCGGPNDRGGRTRICTACLPVSPGAVKRERAARRLAECPADKRWCSLCDEFLPPAQFGKTKDNSCSACLRTKSTTAHLMRDFGLTDEEYEALLVAQDGACAICRNAPKKQRLHVDHNHKTGAIRGLLCLWCNHRLLGGARESVEVLQRAVSYIQEPPAISVIGDRQVPPKKRKGRTSNQAPPELEARDVPA